MRSFLATLFVLALVAGSAFVTQTVLDGSLTPPAAAETTSEPPLVLADNYQQCIQSYIQCIDGCQAYPEPTQTECENWCFQHHWCTQV